jgi:hypothetical protein
MDSEQWGYPKSTAPGYRELEPKWAVLWRGALSPMTVTFVEQSSKGATSKFKRDQRAWKGTNT